MPVSLTMTDASDSVGHRAQADHAPLGGVGEHDQPAARAHHRPVGLGLEQVGRAEAGVAVHAVHAHEDGVDVQGVQRRDRQRPDQRVRRRPQATGQQHRDGVRPRAVQHVGHPDRVGDDREAGDVDAGAGRRRDVVVPAETAIAEPGCDQAGGPRGDRLLLGELPRRLRLEAGLGGCSARRGRIAPPCTFSSSPCVGHDASRSRRTSCPRRRAARPGRLTRTVPVAVQLRQDPGASLRGEHAQTSRTTATAPGCDRSRRPACRSGDQVVSARPRRSAGASVWLTTNTQASPSSALRRTHLDPGRVGGHRLDAGLGEQPGHQRSVPRVVEPAGDVPRDAARRRRAGSAPARRRRGRRRRPPPPPRRRGAGARSRRRRSVPSLSATCSPSAQRGELLDPDAEQVAEGARVATEPDVVVLVDDPAEVGHQSGGTGAHGRGRSRPRPRR